MRERWWDRIAAAPRRHPKLAAAVTLMVGALPAVYIGWLIARWGVEIPLMDDWEMAPLIAKAHTGELTFNDLFEQQEEARTFFPKLIFILSGIDGHWDVRHEMMLSVAICAATAFGIYLLLRRSGAGIVTTALCFWASSLLIFSPAQFELWLFASGFPSFMPVLCIVGALLAFQTGWSTGMKFATAAVLAVISTFTLAHGLLAWGLTFPVFLASNRVRRWQWWLGAWTSLALLAAAAYFYGYRKPAHLPDFGPAMSVGEYAQFFLAYLGGTFAYAAAQHQRVALAATVGAVAFAIFVGTLMFAAPRLRDASFARRFLPWFALAFYSIFSAVLVTLGRGGFGLQYATSSRYVTFSLYLLVAVIVLAAFAHADRGLAARTRWARRALAAAAAICIGGGLYLYHLSFENGIRVMHSINARNRLARSAIVFSPAVDTAAIIKRINYPDPQRVITRAVRLDELGILRPRLVRDPEVSALPFGEVDAQAADGWCDALVAMHGDDIRASGWATLNGKRRPADAVLLAYETPEGEWVAFAMSDAVVRRRDIKRLLGTKDQLWSGWTATFRRDAVPPGAAISAWAVDIEGPRLYRLKQNVPELKL